jgi:hypothetical protein
MNDVARIAKNEESIELFGTYTFEELSGREAFISCACFQTPD